MARTTTVRKYGRTTRKQTAEILFAQLPTTPLKSGAELKPEPERKSDECERESDGPERDPEPAQIPPKLDPEGSPSDDINQLAQQLESTKLETDSIPEDYANAQEPGHVSSPDLSRNASNEAVQLGAPKEGEEIHDELEDPDQGELEPSFYDDLRVITWTDVCAAGDRIEKIAEASFAEVYRITNAHGTSIIKVVRLQSPIKPQTKAQVKSGLVDEEPHSEEDMQGELRISEWLADIPGFVVYKEQYVVQGKAPKALLETHQVFHRRMKRKDPDRLQFYPSPSRYLDDTRFLVVELGDAGTALEDFELTSISQVWDIFLHTALALARAEDLIEFEHRDLHEGNLCIRQVRPPTTKPASSPSARQFGFSGLDITILDYGLSRASNPDSPLPNPTATATATSTPPAEPSKAAAAAAVVAYDLEKDLTLFQSTHAAQCTVYRQMRAFLIHGDRLPGTTSPSSHTTPYPLRATTQTDTNTTTDANTDANANTRISWSASTPYTNVLWLAYLYGYLIQHFPTSTTAITTASKGEKGSKGDKDKDKGKGSRQERELKAFRRETRELRAHLDPAAPRGVLSFPSAGEVVRFAVEAGWVGEGQVVEGVWAGEDGEGEGEGSWVGDGDGDGDGGDTRGEEEGDDTRGEEGDAGKGNRGEGDGDGDGDGNGEVVEREAGDRGQGEEECEERCEVESGDGLGEKAGQDGEGHRSGEQDDGQRDTRDEGIAKTRKSVEEPPLTRPSRRTRRGKVR